MKPRPMSLNGSKSRDVSWSLSSIGRDALKGFKIRTNTVKQAQITSERI